MVEMKCCSVCRTEKSLSAFGKHTRRKDGLRGECKECIRVYSASRASEKSVYKLANAEQIAKKTREWKDKNREHVYQYEKNWRTENSEKFAAMSRKHGRRYRLRHHERLLKKERQVRLLRRDVLRERRRLYDKRFPEKSRAKCVKRRVLKRNGTLPSLTPDDHSEIERCYRQARMLRDLFELDVHVDHIIPLAGGTVCGLHVPWNLRIVPASVNIQKKNTWSEAEGFSPTETFEVCV